MNITSASIRNPYIIIALCLLIAAIGLFAFFKTPVDLFPDTTPPQVLVITVEPGANAKDVSDKVTEIIEKELKSISGLKRIRSVSRDEVSAVTAEFYYSKDADEAVTDVVNAIQRIRTKLPKDILPSQIFKITDASSAVMTLSLSPKKGKHISLSEIRLLAENDIKNALLNLENVGDVDIFGGFMPEVKIIVKRDKLKKYGLSLFDVLIAVSNQNISVPGGYIYTSKREYLVKTTSEFKNVEEIEKVPIRHYGNGYVLLKDVADVFQGTAEQRSLYHGNGKKAIALNILKPEGSPTLDTIKAVKKFLPALQKRFPDINFEITNDQQPIIDINLKGMRSSLVQAIILTVLIIFVFLADKRAAFVISVSIPLSFLFSLVVLNFSPYTMNMVTLSGLIIAVGMVVDASIVVLENIYRYFQTERNSSAKLSAEKGTKEVALANTAGALTTIVVLIPVMFVGEYPQRVLRPLSIMIGSTIFASLIASLTVVPLVASKILSRKQRKKDFFEKIAAKFEVAVKRLSDFYVSFLKVALAHRKKVLFLVFIVFVITLRGIAPMLVGELMPPMDTGIVKVSFDMPSDFNINSVEKVVSKVEKIMLNTNGIVSVSTVIGSEPGEISFGSGGATLQSVSITANLVTRDKRKRTIWDIESEWRKKISKIKGIRSFTIIEYGATPISTTKAPFDLVIAGDDEKVLDDMADDFLLSMDGVKGLVDIRRSWYVDKKEIQITPDSKMCMFYGVDNELVARYIKLAVHGVKKSFLRLNDFLDIPISIEMEENDLSPISKLDFIYVPTQKGYIPLANLVCIDEKVVQPFITREDLKNTIDITAVNKGLTIVQATKNTVKSVKAFVEDLPDGYKIKMSGTVMNMNDTRKRLMKALILSLILLYIILLPMYKSFIYPVVIMLAIPLAVIGAIWGLLIFNKPMCMPAIMGIILLAGTIVNNSILLLDFILSARKKGMSREDAILQSVRIRTRPILMTASSTVIGLTPLIFEMAVGLERLSPLGIVAASGLILGTFLTTIVIPVIYTLFDDMAVFLKRRLNGYMGVFLIAVFAPLFVFSHFNFARAETQPNGKTIGQKKCLPEFSLKDAIEYALKNSPEIKMSNALSEKAKSGKIKAEAKILPSVNFNAMYSNYENNHFIVPGMFGTEQRADKNVVFGKVEASFLITDFGKSFLEYKAQKNFYDSFLSFGNRKKEYVIFSVGCLYFDIVSMNKLIDSYLALKKSMVELKKRIGLFLKVGKSAKIDLLKVNVRIAEIDDNIARLKSRKRYLVMLLGKVMGFKDTLRIKNELVMFDHSGLSDLSVDNEVKKAMKKRYDLKGVDMQISAYSYAVKSSKRAYFPELRIVGEFGEYAGVSDKARFSDGDRWKEDYWVGLKLSFPIFDGHFRKAGKVKAKADYDYALAKKEDMILSVKAELEKAIADINAAEKRIKFAESAKDEAFEALRLEKLKYSEGKSVVNDVLDAEASLRKSEYLYYSAVADYNKSVFELLFSEGKLLEKYRTVLNKEE